jgi:hypothetical protein
MARDLQLGSMRLYTGCCKEAIGIILFWIGKGFRQQLFLLGQRFGNCV